MISMIFLALSLGLVCAERQLNFFSSDLTGATNSYTYTDQGNQDSFGNFDDYSGTPFGLGFGQFSANATQDVTGVPANAGNNFTLGSLTNSDAIVEGLAYDNSAKSDNYFANSGNFQNFGDLTDSNLVINDTAFRNYAFSEKGDANAGNQVSTGDLDNTDFTLNAKAFYNDARSLVGDANAGNELFINSVDTDSNLEISQEVLGNTAYSRDGNANIGNVLEFGGLRRKLMKAHENCDS